jgi:SIR2-like domain
VASLSTGSLSVPGDPEEIFVLLEKPIAHSARCYMVDIPTNLLDALRSKKVVLFLGAGASLNARHPEGHQIPTSNDLRDIISNQFLASELKDRSLAEIVEYAVNETDLLTVQRFVRDIFIPFTPSDYHEIIPLFPWRAIFTTNLDLIIERAYQNTKDRAQNPVVLLKNSQRFDQELRSVADSVELVKLHGSCDHFQDLEIPFILATEQYTKFSENRSRLFNRLVDIAEEYNLVFCGYSVLDPHIQAILHSMFALGAIRPAYFIAKPNFSSVENRYWTSKRVTPIPATFEGFLRSLQATINPKLVAAGIYATGGGHPVRRFYNRSTVTETADLTSFLGQDVSLVHSGMTATTQSAEEFYKGFDTGFYPVMSDMDVRRNLADTILATIFLRDEDKLTEPDFFLVKSAAGTGKTILLKRIAWEAATEFDCLVLYHNNGGSLRSSALEELFSYVGRRIFLVVDRAAYYVDEIAQLLDICKAKSLPITIITAERENEWAVRCEKLDQRLDGTFELHRFSHNEIVSLLDKLSEFKSLGHLEQLTPEQRLKEFEIRAERQILVILYELTQGVPFEQVIVDEYERIIPTEAQLLYRDICCLNRLNVPVRAGLISRVSNIHFSEFKARFLDPLKRIVTAERDQYVGDMMYSARHATIAQIVFESILNDQEKRFDVLVRIIKAMNLSYSSDEIAFKAIVTGREIAELFPSQLLGRQFFDAAMEVAGQDAAILQQRANFEISHSGGSRAMRGSW